MHHKVRAALEQSPYEWREVRHDAFERKIRSPKDFAMCLGYDLDRITKTLFMQDHKGDMEAFAVCSVTKKAPLTQIAEQLGVTRLEMASRDLLKARIGYPPTSVTPIGCAQVVFMDEALLSLPSILTGSGEPGIEIELAPGDLQSLCNPTLLTF